MTTKKATKKKTAKVTKTEGVIVLITGSREMDNFEYLKTTLDKYAIAGIVHGDAKGADTLAQKYAEANDILTARHPITPQIWDKLGRKAGPLRNQAMLDQHPTISLVLAFPVKDSRGTADMISRALKASITTHVFFDHGCSK